MDKNLGILLAVSSLPGRHGIGDFGDSAYRFIDWLSKNKYRYWQVLPINPLGPGYSPYMSSCSNAIEYRYISLDFLKKEGLLTELPHHHMNDVSVDYKDVGEFKLKYLWIAFTKFMALYPETLHKFKVRHKWVMKYATFAVLRAHNNDLPWNEWNEKDRDYFKYHNNPPKGYLYEINFVIFTQYVALKQWKSIRAYARKKGIIIICDVPFYVGFDGVECWMNRDQFSIDPETNKLYEVGGVGPDAFSSEGQLWGTPIYNFEKMKEDHYSLLCDRIGNLMELCDVLRLDHFRAFDTYYVIPANEQNAKNGEWKLGPGEEFFKELYKKYPETKLIAEDLGDLRPEVHELRKKLDLPGMYVVQFMIFDNNNMSNEKQIVYPGTHDNETLYAWFNSLPQWDIDFLKQKLDCKSNDNRILFNYLIKYIYGLPSYITIFQLQDILKLGSETRMNCPGTMDNKNWSWKLKNFDWMNNVKIPKKEWIK